MKQTKKTDLRQEWKDSIDYDIDLLIDDIEEMELPEDLFVQLSKKISEFKERVNTSISSFEITPEIALQDKDLLSNMLDEVKYDGLKEDDADCMKDMLEMEGYFVIKAPSLSEQIKIEAFIENLKENPYQLQLIA